MKCRYVLRLPSDLINKRTIIPKAAAKVAMDAFIDSVKDSTAAAMQT
jgi:hypothetical protein